MLPGCKRTFLNAFCLSLLIIGVAGGAIYIEACSSGITKTGNSSEAFPKYISVEQAAAKIAAGAFILDVRNTCEWGDGYIPKAVLIPINQLDKRLNELPHDREIVVVCKTGARSRIGIEILRKAGFEKSSSMAGGLNAWQSTGYPTENGNSSAP